MQNIQLNIRHEPNNFFDLVPGNPVKLKVENKDPQFNPVEAIKIYSLIDSFN